MLHRSLRHAFLSVGLLVTIFAPLQGARAQLAASVPRQEKQYLGQDLIAQAGSASCPANGDYTLTNADWWPKGEWGTGNTKLVVTGTIQVSNCRYYFRNGTEVRFAHMADYFKFSFGLNQDGVNGAEVYDANDQRLVSMLGTGEAANGWNELGGKNPSNANWEEQSRVVFKTSYPNASFGPGPYALGIYVYYNFLKNGSGGTLNPGASGTQTNAVSFGAKTGTALEATTLVEIPVDLTFANAKGLQGLQVDVATSSSLVQFVGASRGAAVANTTNWQVSTQANGATKRVLVLGNGTNALASGQYKPLVVLQFSVAELPTSASTEVQITLSGAVGALASPNGEDAVLQIGDGVYKLTVQPRTAAFSASATALDLGNVAVGQTGTQTVTVTNPAASTRPLTISGVASSNARFTVAPTSASLAPGASQVFTVTFAPTAQQSGAQAGTLTFTHNAGAGVAVAASTSGVALAGRGTYGRGDAEGDGRVDVSDLVRAIDFVLGRETPTALGLTAADLYPFPAGDGQVDVRDLTVLAQAIVRGVWPDAVGLPASVGGASVIDAEQLLSAAAGASDVRVNFQTVGAQSVLTLSSGVALRALQLELQVDERAIAGILPGAIAEAGMIMMTHVADGRLRLLAYRLDGQALAPGDVELARLQLSGVLQVRAAEGTAVDASGVRHTIHTQYATAADGAPDDAGRFELGSVYPNPFRAVHPRMQATLTLPEASPVRVWILDLQGRQVAKVMDATLPAGRQVIEWDGVDLQGRRVSAGVYFMRAETNAGTRSRTLVIMP